jgi:hypothetical protein
VDDVRIDMFKIFRIILKRILILKRENPINDCNLGLNFTTNYEVLGKVEEYELKPGGRQIELTDENKQEYLRYLESIKVLLSVGI